MTASARLRTLDAGQYRKKTAKRKMKYVEVERSKYQDKRRQELEARSRYRLPSP
jgi:hypothetical protein